MVGAGFGLEGAGAPGVACSASDSARARFNFPSFSLTIVFEAPLEGRLVSFAKGFSGVVVGGAFEMLILGFGAASVFAGAGTGADEADAFPFSPSTGVAGLGVGGPPNFSIRRRRIYRITKVSH